MKSYITFTHKIKRSLCAEGGVNYKLVKVVLFQFPLHNIMTIWRSPEQRTTILGYVIC